jgi:hypothetical protein
MARDVPDDIRDAYDLTAEHGKALQHEHPPYRRTS